MLLLAIGSEALSTVAFDCSQQEFEKLEIATYSLLDVHACYIQKPVVETKEFIGQIVQTKLYDYRTVSQCKVKIKRTIRRCSLFGYLEPVENGYAEFLIDLSNEQCKRMHLTRSFTYDSNHVLTDIRINQTTTRSMSFAGDAIGDSCNVGSYSDRFGTWSKVNVEGIITITLASYTAKVDITNDKILLRSGVTCKYSETSCLDIENGFTFWETLEYNDCSDNKLEVLYENKIQVVTEVRNNVTKHFYFVNYNGHVASFKFNGMHEVCRRALIKTEFPDIYIIDKNEEFVQVKSRVFPNLVTYVNAKFVYAERETRNEMQKLYEEVINKRCESDMTVLRDSLNLAYISPDLFAYNLLGPGYMAHVSGEGIRIVKCLPVEVLIRTNASSCYKQIPIVYRNRDMFITSKTKIIIKHGSEIKCNKPLSQIFKIDGTWYTFLPELIRIEEPKMLSPDSKNNWQPKDVSDLATKGLFTREEMNEYSRSINFPIERENILDNTAQIISRQFDEKPVEHRILTWNYWSDLKNYYWQTIKDFGSLSGAILGITGIIWILVASCKLGCQTLSLANIIENIFGCFMACVTAITTKWSKRRINSKSDEMELQEIKTEDGNYSIKSHNYQKSYPFSRKNSVKSLKSNTSTINPISKTEKTYVDIHEIPPSNLERMSI